jgi:hypothetical protein
MVLPSAVPADTDPAAFAVLVECWRSMTVSQRAPLTEQICTDVELIARAGIVACHPTYSELEIRRELARRRYGNAIADAAYAGRESPR